MWNFSLSHCHFCSIHCLDDFCLTTVGWAATLSCAVEMKHLVAHPHFTRGLRMTVEGLESARRSLSLPMCYKRRENCLSLYLSDYRPFTGHCYPLLIVTAKQFSWYAAQSAFQTSLLTESAFAWFSQCNVALGIIALFQPMIFIFINCLSCE